MSNTELAVKGIFVMETSDKITPFVILADDTGRIMPIDVGYSQAVSIDIILHQKVPSRPMTHDLMMNVLSELNATIDSVVIDDIIEGIYYGRLILTIDSMQREFDARPSDCVALAIRAGAPIYVDTDLFDLTAMDPEVLAGMKGLDELGY